MASYIDITGERFGRLLVLGVSEQKQTSGRSKMWDCLCDCGNTVTVSGQSLRNGHTRSCGCLNREFAQRIGNSRAFDLSGMEFGDLTVIERCGTRNGNAMWVCWCRCGNYTRVSASSLMSGRTRSCGCLRVHRNRQLFLTHGGAMFGEKERLYSIWCSMKYRCEVETSSAFADYGGRGIRVCDEWHSYEKFRSWALQNGYSDMLSIDRIDVNKNYEPNNCRWADKGLQANNRRSNVVLEYGGECHTVTEWGKIMGINPSTIRARLKRGWPVEDSITKPKRG